MSNKIRGVIVDVNKRKFDEIVFEDTLENIYNILGVDYIDVSEKRCGKFVYDFVVDDEGLLKECVIPSVFDKEGKPMLVGNVLAVSHNEDGDFISLNDEMVSNLIGHIGTLTFGGNEIPVIAGCD